MVEWRSEYSVGIRIMDDQHRELLKLLEELLKALEQNAKMDVDYVLTKLEVYGLYHFASEEQLMARYGFDGLEEHKKEHAGYKDVIKELRDEFEAAPENGKEIAKKILAYGQEWVDNHLLGTDMKYARFLDGKIEQ